MISQDLRIYMIFIKFIVHILLKKNTQLFGYKSYTIANHEIFILSYVLIPTLFNKFQQIVNKYVVAFKDIILVRKIIIY